MLKSHISACQSTPGTGCGCLVCLVDARQRLMLASPGAHKDRGSPTDAGRMRSCLSVPRWHEAAKRRRSAAQQRHSADRQAILVGCLSVGLRCDHEDVCALLGYDHFFPTGRKRQYLPHFGTKIRTHAAACRKVEAPVKRRSMRCWL